VKGVCVRMCTKHTTTLLADAGYLNEGLRGDALDGLGQAHALLVAQTETLFAHDRPWWQRMV
jgi:hypothetical protein